MSSFRRYLASLSPQITWGVYCSTVAEPEEAPVAEPQTVETVETAEGWSGALSAGRRGSRLAVP